MAVLEVKDLHVSFRTDRGTLNAVRGVSFRAERGKTLAIVGESGSGKTTCILSILGLNPPAARTVGQVLFHGSDLLSTSPQRLRDIRGNRISVVLQDPLSGLHPYYTVGWQIAEAIRAHRSNVSRKKARAAAVDALARVGLSEPQRVAASYPFQLSGGMRQRSMIAMAIVLDPEVLIADEPTTALDATVRAEILELIHRLQGDLDMSVILVSHDLNTASAIADEVVVMYAGLVVELANRGTLFDRPCHPYTTGLLNSSLGSHNRHAHLDSIPGSPPDPLFMPEGCAFHPRCPRAIKRCAVEAPRLESVHDCPSHQCACWVAGGGDEQASSGYGLNT